MSYIPDCRTDKVYNEKHLDVLDKEFIAGADWMLDQIINMIENNVDTYPDLEMILADNIVVIEAGKDKIVSDAIKHWAEMERNEMITSIIDGYSDEQYKAVKVRVDDE